MLVWRNPYVVGPFACACEGSPWVFLGGMLPDISCSSMKIILQPSLVVLQVALQGVLYLKALQQLCTFQLAGPRRAARHPVGPRVPRVWLDRA